LIENIRYLLDDEMMLLSKIRWDWFYRIFKFDEEFAMSFFSSYKGMAFTGGALAIGAFATTLYAAPMVVMPLVGDIATLLVNLGAFSLLSQTGVIAASILSLGILAAITGAIVFSLGLLAYKRFAASQEGSLDTLEQSVAIDRRAGA
jgi:hypothetical protein